MTIAIFPHSTLTPVNRIKWFLKKFTNCKINVVVHAYNASNWKAEAGTSLEDGVQHVLCYVILFSKIPQTRKEKKIFFFTVCESN